MYELSQDELDELEAEGAEVIDELDIDALVDGLKEVMEDVMSRNTVALAAAFKDTKVSSEGGGSVDFAPLIAAIEKLVAAKRSKYRFEIKRDSSKALKTVIAIPIGDD